MRKIYAVALLCFIVNASFGQETETEEEDLYALSLEELMNIPIQSASKKKETVFEAPLSSYTITRTEIDRSGVTSIMEALRLAPGVIVREQSNGIYDIQIRGMENLTRNHFTFFKPNAYTLVMIDNRPVFNHSLGGTFWESLPVDLNDVERIEIVRGPSSPLFGPNAVTGVINVITKRPDGAKRIVNANVQGGTLNTLIGNVTLGQSITDKLSILVSANYQDRSRLDENYYDEATGGYVPLSTLVPDDSTRAYRYPYPSRSLRKWGLNGNVKYAFSDRVSADLSLSRQLAASQRIFATNPLTYANTDNTAANLALSIYHLKIRTSYLDGYNSDNKTPGPNGEYDYKVADVVAEYDFKFKDRYTLTPGVSYQNVSFDDRPYTSAEVAGYYNASRAVNTRAAFVRTDLSLTSKLRVIGGLRVDQFSVPDKAYLAYELASTYKLNDKHLVRFAVTRSNSGSFIGYNYVSVVSPTGSFLGNTNQKLLTMDMIEIGYRAQVTGKLQLDLDVFQQKAKNLTAIMIRQFAPVPIAQFENIPTTATQLGFTLSLNYVASEKVQFKPFITIQKTETKDKPVIAGMPSDYIDPAISPVPVVYTSSTHKYTPASFGGFYFNYRPVSKFNLNLNGYYFGKQSQYDLSWSEQNPTTPQYAEGQIKSKFMLSAKASYEVVKGLSLFVNARNLFNEDSREFYAADRTQGLYLAGATFNFVR